MLFVSVPDWNYFIKMCICCNPKLSIPTPFLPTSLQCSLLPPIFWRNGCYPWSTPFSPLLNLPMKCNQPYTMDFASMGDAVSQSSDSQQSSSLFQLQVAPIYGFNVTYFFLHTNQALLCTDKSISPFLAKLKSEL